MARAGQAVKGAATLRPSNKRVKLSAGAASLGGMPKRLARRPPQLTRSVTPLRVQEEQLEGGCLMTTGDRGDRSAARSSVMQRRSAGTLCPRSKRYPVNITLPRRVLRREPAVRQLTTAAGMDGFLAIASDESKAGALGDGDFGTERRNTPLERLWPAARSSPLNASVMPTGGVTA